MPLYLISCALRQVNHDFAPLWQALEDAKGHRALESTWLLESEQGIEALTKALLSHLTRRDGLLIVEIPAGARWSATRMLPGSARWLKRRRP